MKNSRFIQTLSLIDKKEFTSFLKFIEFHTEKDNSAIANLTKLLQREHPQFSLSKEELFNKAFPQENYDAKKLTRLFHKGLKILNDFICFDQIQNNSLLRQELLTKFAHKRNSSILFDRHCNKWNDLSEQLDWSTGTLEQYRITIARKKFATQQAAMNPRSFRIKEEEVDRLNVQLNSFERLVIHHSYSLSSQGIAINHRMLKDIKVHDKYLLSLIDHHEKSNIKSEKYPGYEFMIEEALRSHQIMRLNNPDDHEALSEKMINDADEVSLKDQRRIIYYLMHNIYHDYSIINRKKNQKAFQLYRLLAERNNMSYQNILSPTGFSSLCHLALDLQEYEWYRQFIAENCRKLPKEKQKEYHMFYTGLLLMETQKPAEALECLNALEEIKSELYTQVTKKYQVMLHYDLESDHLERVMNKYRVSVFRNNHTFSDQLKKDQLFINCLYQLVNCPPGKSAKLSKIRKIVKEQKSMFESKWFLRVIDEKMNKTKS